MTVIDFHNHYYPPSYLKEIEKGPSVLGYSVDDDGNPCLASPGDINVIVPGHRDIAYREEVIAKVGVDVQILTFTAPATHVETPERAVALAAMVNDALAEICRERPEHFTALATLPLNDPAGSLAEFRRATEQLGFKGVMVFSNVNGVALADERYWPLYEDANDKGAVFMIHPTYPLGVEAMLDYWIMPLIGFTMDTTIAAAKLVFSGVAERFPNIKWVLGHLGGAIPYLAERLDRGFEAFADCRVNIDKKPSEYLREFYYDSVNFDPNALQLAIDFAGVDRIVAGSDYPHKIGSLEKMLSSIAALDLSDEDREKILSGNAGRLLGL